MKRILVGLDENELASAAVDAALDLAKKFDGRVEFLHAVPGFWGWTLLSETYGKRIATTLLGNAREERLAYLKVRFAEKGIDVAQLEESVIVTLERPAEALLHRAQRPGCDLLVLGAHEQHGPFDFGGTARAVLAASPCPVWVQRSDVQPIRHVLAPIHTLQDNEHSLVTAREVARAHGAHLTVLHCFVPPVPAYPPQGLGHEVPPEAMLDELKQRERQKFCDAVEGLDLEGVSFSFVFDEGNPSERILAQPDVDLICMGTQTGNRIVKTVLGSVAYGVLKDARQAVLVCPRP